MMQVRKMREQDILELIKLCDEIREHHRDVLGGYFTNQDDDFERNAMYSMLEDEKHMALVAEEDEEIAGLLFAEFKISPMLEKSNICHIHNIGVWKETRGKGIGKAMMDALYAECQKRGIDEIKLGVFNANVNSYKFYEKYGFKPLEQRMNLVVK